MIRIDSEKIEQLAIYNAERRRGLLHGDVYNRDMAHLQECYDQMIAELADVLLRAGRQVAGPEEPAE